MGQPVELPSPNGGVVLYLPAFHVSILHCLVVSGPNHTIQHEADFQLFQEIYDAVVGCYVEGNPIWRVDPPKSSICVLSRKEIAAMDEDSIQAVFQTQHILVRNQFQPTLAFDEDGLGTLAHLDKPVTLQGE